MKNCLNGISQENKKSLFEVQAHLPFVLHNLVRLSYDKFVALTAEGILVYLKLRTLCLKIHRPLFSNSDRHVKCEIIRKVIRQWEDDSAFGLMQNQSETVSLRCTHLKDTYMDTEPNKDTESNMDTNADSTISDYNSLYRIKNVTFYIQGCADGFSLTSKSDYSLDMGELTSDLLALQKIVENILRDH